MTSKYVEKAIYEKIKTIAGGRVYALLAPENSAPPFVVYTRTASQRRQSINNSLGIAIAVFQIDVYANTLYDAKDTSVLIEDILEKFKGTVSYGTDSPQDFVNIVSLSLQNEFDLLDQTVQPFLYRNTMIFNVGYEQ